MAGHTGRAGGDDGCILPSLIIVSLLSWLYEKYRSMDAMQAVLACLRPAVVALIASRGADDSAGGRVRGRSWRRGGADALRRAVCRCAVVLRVKHSNRFW